MNTDATTLDDEMAILHALSLAWNLARGTDVLGDRNQAWIKMTDEATAAFFKMRAERDRLRRLVA